MTAIRLPREKRTISKTFSQKPQKEKELKILSWVVSPSKAKAIQEKKVKISLRDLENLTHVELHDGLASVQPDELNKFKKFCEKDAFIKFKGLVAEKLETSAFKCGLCELLLNAVSSILCECCLLWHHLNMDCAGCIKAPNGPWFCRTCA